MRNWFFVQFYLGYNVEDFLLEQRKLSYLINNFDDYNLPCSHQFLSNKELVNQVIEFFKTESLLIYPAKSYFVAIVYAYCLNKYFNQDFYEILDDKDLLPDDKYFIRYSENHIVYDKIIQSIGNIWQYKSIEKTVKYFKQEFLIKED